MSGARFLKGPKTPILTALPTGLAASDDGLEINFLADAANGVVWRLRYRHYAADGVTLNASPYKWELVGGGFLESVVETVLAMPAFLPSPTPAVVVPLAGDWEFDHGAYLTNNGSASAGFIIAGLTTDGTTRLVGADVSAAYAAGGAGIGQGHADSRRGTLTFAAGANVRQGYTLATTGACGARFVRLRPKRVG